MKEKKKERKNFKIKKIYIEINDKKWRIKCNFYSYNQVPVVDSTLI